MLVRRTSLICTFLFGWISLFGNEGTKWITADLKDLESSAQDGDSYAQAFLALCYIHGDKGLNISFDKASYWANLSTETEHWLGWFTMGYLHRFSPLGPNSEKVGQFYKKVFKNPDGTLVKSVSTGDPVASYVLAEIFTAEEVEPEINSDLQFAAKHYANSSNLGYGPASVQHALLKLHANAIEGQNIEIGKDLAGGVFILKEAAEKQLPAANHFLGRCYFKGIGVGEDYKMALVHFQAAADRGFTTSQLIVAHFYAYGLTGPAKIDLALRYANLALLQETEKASEKIAEYEQLLINQSEGITQPVVQRPNNSVPSPISPSLIEPPPLPPEPIGLPEPPAFSPVANRLPSVYENIKTKDPVLSPKPSPTKSLSEEGLQDLSLAKQHYFGRGSNLDLKRAFQLFSQSASIGNPEAARYLGIMYLRGKGVPKDSQKALEWFTKAAAGGDELAKKNVKTLQILSSRN
tara:strand:- start:118 stop:1509 length:1392 start_codon:yes stop_codon:yes gene_type:complete